MKFSRKIFISVFLAALVVGAGIIWASYKYVGNQTRENFISRYTVFSRVLGDTLTRLDLNTEALMHNAAQVLEAKDVEQGLLSTSELKLMLAKLNVTHIFVVNKNGDFIRSTNEDPKLIPNVYSFCSEYKNMIVGFDNVAATPIIHPQPEPKPYKFLFVPSRNRDRLLEVGVRVDFIAKTLSEALGSDKNVLYMSVYDPKGTSFGSFRSKSYDFKESKINLPSTFPTFVEDDEVVKFYSKVVASHTQCCQCDVSGTSINGEYYYVLESVISKSELKAALARTKATFLAFAIAITLIAFLLAYSVSRRLVKNIELAADRVRNIKMQSNFMERIRLDGKDEVAYLTREFDVLLDNLEETKKQVVEAEKIKAKIQLAKEVAHNIKSPLHAIELMMPMMLSVPQRIREVLKTSVKDIRGLTNKLHSQADSMFAASGKSTLMELVFLPKILDDLTYQKQIEYSDKNINIELEVKNSAKDAFVKVCGLELKAILSNLINNAVDSYGSEGGTVLVTVGSVDDLWLIEVCDYGVGIPLDYLSRLGAEQITFKGDASRGVGLMHAFKVVEGWGGKINVSSELGNGTKIKIMLKKFKQQPKVNDAIASI